MPAKYIPGQGFVSSYEQEQEQISQQNGFSIFDQIQPGMSPFEMQMLQRERATNQQTQQQIDNAPIEPVKPFLSGATVTDVLEAFPNAATAMVTDLLDLGAGIGDLASETYRSVTDPDYDFNDSGELFNDANNPWTQFRRNFGGGMGISETYAGEIVSTGLRLATIALPWNWANPGKYVKVPNQVARLGNTLNKIRGIGTRGPGATARLQRIATGRASNLGKLSKTSGAVRATNIALKNDYLTESFKAISAVPEAKTWWKATQQQVSAVLKTKLQFKNVAETIAFDSLAGFMIFGEGDESLDETMFDFAASLGIDIPDSLQTTIEDTSIERKLKGMLDGGLIGYFGGALVDLFRIRRYAKALKEATPAQRAQILRAFKEEAEILGRGVGEFAAKQAARQEEMFMRQGADFANSPVQNALAQTDGAASDLSQGSFENFAKAQPADLPEPVPGLQDPFAYEANQLPSGVRGGELQLNTLVNQVDRARLDQQRIAQLDAAERQNRLNKQGAAGFVSREGQPQLEGTTTPGRAPTDATSLDAAPYPDNAPRGAGIEPAQVTVLGQSNIEPTITPQTIRRAVYEAMNSGMSAKQITAGVQKLLPERRINLIDYIQSADLQRNSAGVIPAADSIWYNTILQRGLNEGWISLDPETFRTAINRKVALDLDQADLANKAARGIDQAEDAARYEDYLRSADTTNNDSMRPEVQADLQAKDAEAVTSSTEGFTVPDPAVDDGIRQAEEATLQSQGLSDSELERMAAEITADADPDDVIADGLGIDVRQLPTFEVQKTGRQYTVVGPDGEIVEGGRYTTKKQALKRAEKETATIKEGLLRQAQQQLIDRDSQPLPGARFPEPSDGDLKASVKLTEGQYKAVQQYLTGDPSKLINGRTLELSQNELNEIAGDIRVRLELGEIKGNEARVLRNLVEKLDTAVADLAPEIRRQRTIQQARDNASTFLNHGEYC